jgi:hypothetical protein
LKWAPPIPGIFTDVIHPGNTRIWATEVAQNYVTVIAFPGCTVIHFNINEAEILYLNFSQNWFDFFARLYLTILFAFDF